MTITNRVRLSVLLVIAAVCVRPVFGIGSCTSPNPNPNPNPTSFAAPSDFNGDCKSDILWRNNSTDEIYIWLMNGNSILSQGGPAAPSSDWAILGTGDFDGDGKSDILFRNSSTDEVYIWLMNGTTIASQGSLGSITSDWMIQDVGDFDGDGKSDILWRNSTTGEVYLWFMNGITIAGRSSLGSITSDWVIQGTGDFNGDGKADILWWNNTSGEVYIWLMNGATITSQGSPFTLTSDWVIQGVGDFDGNGKSDILWRNRSSGLVYIWLMNGFLIAGQGGLGTVSSDWVIQGVGDFDGDGKSDILWRNISSGTVNTWLINGLSIASYGSPGSPALQWQIASARQYALPNDNADCPKNCRQITWVTGSDLWNSGVLPSYTGAACGGVACNGSTDDGPAMQTCINSASANTAVLLPAGVCYVNSIVRLKSSVVLRGAQPEGKVTMAGIPATAPTPEPGSTTIVLGTGGILTTQNFSSGGAGLTPSTSSAAFPTTYCNLGGTPQKGDTTVTISGGSCTVSVGTWIEVYGNDDPTLISSTGSDGHCDWCGNNTGFYTQVQIVQVTGLTGGGGVGSVLTLSQPLYYTLDTNAETVPGPGGSGTETEPAGAKFTIIAFGTQKAGYENLRVDASEHNIGGGQIILLQGCLYCWVKAVETNHTGNSSGSAHIEMDYTYGSEIRDGAYHDQGSGASGSGYGVYFQFANGNAKVENNIMVHNRHWIVYQGGGSGTYVGYNFASDNLTEDCTYIGSGRTSHGAHPFFNLFEGNITSRIAADDFWGSSSHDVFFRNWIQGGELDTTWPAGNIHTVGSAQVDNVGGCTPYTFPPNTGFEAVSLYTGQPYYSFVDNVLGNPGLASGISGTWSAATLTGTCTSSSGGNTTCDSAAPGAPEGTPIVYETGGTLTLGGHATVASSTTTIIKQGNYDYKTLGVAFNDGGTGLAYPASYYYYSKPAFITGNCLWPEQGSDLIPVDTLLQPAYQRAMGNPACQ